MNEPVFPSIAPREVGIQLNLTYEDLPEDWCEFLIKLGKHILNLCHEEPAAFQIQIKEFRDYLMQLQEAITLYEEKAGQEDPTVPAWYEEIGAAWRKECDEDSWLSDVLGRVCDYTKSKELELMADLLLNMLQLDWPDFVEVNIADINQYLGAHV